MKVTNMERIRKLNEQIARLAGQRNVWKWAPDNPLNVIEEPILAVLDETIHLYPNVTPEQRDYIRKMIRRNPPIGYYLGRCVADRLRKLRSGGNANDLHEALIAISIENDQFGGYRDMLIMLGDLWLAVTHMGIDPLPYFKAVASFSSSDIREFGGSSVESMLANFHTCAHFKEAVEPNLTPV